VTALCYWAVSELGSVININTFVVVILHIAEMCVIMHMCVCVSACANCKGENT
jgi:hypothetical protein